MNGRLLIFLVFLTYYVRSQNSGIILNGYLSNFTSCPTNLGEVFKAVGFDSPSLETPDFYSSCSTQFATILPQTRFGYQMSPNMNSNFFGIFCTLGNQPAPIYFEREYVRGTFNIKPKLGRKYCYSNLINLPNCVYKTINNIGIYLTNSTNQNQFYNIYKNLPLNPNYEYPNYITDTIGWQNINFSYVSNGTEMGFIVGNFRDTSQTDTSYNLYSNYPLCNGNISNYAYFFLTGFTMFEMTAALGNDTSICIGDQLELADQDTLGPDDIWWYKNGVLLDSMKRSIMDIPNVSSDYVMQKRFACGNVSDTMHVTITDCKNQEIIFDLLNVFTPNGDGVNDEFYIKNNAILNLKEFEVSIYNRWGNKVYQNTNPDFKWKGDNVVNGVYYYIITAKNDGGKEYRQSSYLEVIK